MLFSSFDKRKVLILAWHCFTAGWIGTSLHRRTSKDKARITYPDSLASPGPTTSLISESNRPVLIKLETIIGLEVAPVAPSSRLVRTNSGSILSNQSFVPELISDVNECDMIYPCVSLTSSSKSKPLFKESRPESLYGATFGTKPMFSSAICN